MSAYTFLLVAVAAREVVVSSGARMSREEEGAARLRSTATRTATLLSNGCLGVRVDLVVGVALRERGALFGFGWQARAVVPPPLRFDNPIRFDNPAWTTRIEPNGDGGR